MYTRGLAEAAIQHLRERGWQCEPVSVSETPLPEVLEPAPGELITWVSSFSYLASPDETVWFLARDDYGPETDDTFSWDAFERLSIREAVTETEREAVTEFWRDYLPILLSVRGGYEYLALAADGSVVHGEAPDFEATTTVAESLHTFLGAIAGETEGLPETQTPLSESFERLLFGVVSRR